MGNKVDVMEFKCKDLKRVKIRPGKNIPVRIYQVAAGTSSTRFEDFENEGIDLREYLLKNEDFTNLFKVMSDSLEPEIRKGDHLLVDEKIAIGLMPQQFHGKLIACIFEGESLVKRYKWDGKNGILMSNNPLYEPRIVNDWQYFKIHGICTFLIRAADNFSWNNPVRDKYVALKEIHNIRSNHDLSPEKKLFLIEKIMDKIIPRKY
jgi:SOS-response transcriptional repressor LexA